MNTGTAATRAAVSQSWQPVLNEAGPEGQAIGEQLLAIAHAIASAKLAGSLTDPGREGEDKASLAAGLFRGKADDRAVELLQALVRGRWSKPVDLVSALHDLGIEAILSGARSEGSLDAVEQEILSVSRLLDSNRELREALEPSRLTTTDARVRLAERVLGPSLSEAAMALVVWSVRHRTEGGVPRNLRRVAELAAGLQSRSIADVVTAVPMTSAQEERLRSVLAKRLGTDVELNTSVDPAVIGGVKVTVRDLVIDSTLRASIRGVRSELAG